MDRSGQNNIWLLEHIFPCIPRFSCFVDFVGVAYFAQFVSQFEHYLHRIFQNVLKTFSLNFLLFSFQCLTVFAACWTLNNAWHDFFGLYFFIIYSSFLWTFWSFQGWEFSFQRISSFFWILKSFLGGAFLDNFLTIFFVFKANFENFHKFPLFSLSVIPRPVIYSSFLWPFW